MCQAGSLLSPWRLGLKGSRHPVRGTPDVVLTSVYHLLVFQSTGNWREKNTLSLRPLGKHRAAHLWGPCDKVQDKWERRSCFHPCLLKPLGTPAQVSCHSQAHLQGWREASPVKAILLLMSMLRTLHLFRMPPHHQCKDTAVKSAHHEGDTLVLSGVFWSRGSGGARL